MSVAHLPGCDLNHKPRQRCSTADLGLAISTQSAAIGVHGQIVSSRQKLGCFVALLLPLLVLWIVISFTNACDQMATNDGKANSETLH